MAISLRLARSSTAGHAAVTRPAGEVTLDTDKKTVVAHDGTTAGGIPMAREDHAHSAATTGAAGFMSAADKTKLNAVGTMANRALTISTSDPSGGVDGDVWFKV